MTKAEQEECGILSAIPTRSVSENTRGRKPGHAYWESDIVEKDGKKMRKWIDADEPTEKQKYM